jgi:hypothetical protein
MANIRYIANVLNQKGAPAIFEDTFANRPTAGYTGRIFISTDTFVIQRDNGTGWDSLGGGGGISGTGAAGQVTFWTGASAVSGDNGLFWDNTNRRLGINTVTPGVRLDIHGTGVIAQFNGTTTNNAYLDFQNAGTSKWRIGNNYNGAANDFSIFDNTNSRHSFAAIGSQRFLINSPDLSLAVPSNNSFEIYKINSGFLSIGLMDYSNTNNGNGFNVWKTRGTSKGSYSQTLDGDTLFALGSFGSTNSAFTGSNTIISFQTGSVGTFAPARWEFNVNTAAAQLVQMILHPNGYNYFLNRVNVNNATDNALFELNNNGNFYTGGLSPTILTVAVNTTMARTVTGYYCTSTLTLTLPSAASLNNIYYVIAGLGVTVTVNRAGTDDILSLTGTSVTSITVLPNQRAMFYVGGGTRTFLISQA